MISLSQVTPNNHLSTSVLAGFALGFWGQQGKKISNLPSRAFSSPCAPCSSSGVHGTGHHTDTPRNFRAHASGWQCGSNAREAFEQLAESEMKKTSFPGCKKGWKSTQRYVVTHDELPEDSLSWTGTCRKAFHRLSNTRTDAEQLQRQSLPHKGQPREPPVPGRIPPATASSIQLRGWLQEHKQPACFPNPDSQGMHHSNWGSRVVNKHFQNAWNHKR